MRKLCALILAMTMVFAIAGCSAKPETSDISSDISAEAASTSNTETSANENAAEESSSEEKGDEYWNAVVKSQKSEYVGQIEMYHTTPGVIEVEESGWSRAPYQESEDGSMGYALSMGAKIKNTSDETVGVCPIYEVIDKDNKVIFTSRTSEHGFGLEPGDVAPELILNPNETGAIGITETVGDRGLVPEIAGADHLRMYLITAPIAGYHANYEYDRGGTIWNVKADKDTPYEGTKLVQASAKINGELESADNERLYSNVSILFYNDGKIVGGDSAEAPVTGESIDEKFNGEKGLYADVVIGAICSDFTEKEFFISLIPGVHEFAGSPTAEWQEWFKNEIGTFTPPADDVDRSAIEGSWVRAGYAMNNTPNYIELKY